MRNALGAQANWPNLARGGMYHGWLPLALSLAAGGGLPRRTAGPRGRGCVQGNSWQWTQLPDCKSSTIVPPIVLMFLEELVLSSPPAKGMLNHKQRKEKDACELVMCRFWREPVSWWIS